MKFLFFPENKPNNKEKDKNEVKNKEEKVVWLVKTQEQGVHCEEDALDEGHVDQFYLE